jgi:hypothetical protein
VAQWKGVLQFPGAHFIGQQLIEIAFSIGMVGCLAENLETITGAKAAQRPMRLAETTDSRHAG